MVLWAIDAPMTGFSIVRALAALIHSSSGITLAPITVCQKTDNSTRRERTNTQAKEFVSGDVLTI
jgi:hypothetical protein